MDDSPTTDSATGATEHAGMRWQRSLMRQLLPLGAAMCAIGAAWALTGHTAFVVDPDLLTTRDTWPAIWFAALSALAALLAWLTRRSSTKAQAWVVIISVVVATPVALLIVLFAWLVSPPPGALTGNYTLLSGLWMFVGHSVPLFTPGALALDHLHHRRQERSGRARRQPVVLIVWVVTFSVATIPWLLH